MIYIYWMCGLSGMYLVAQFLSSLLHEQRDEYPGLYAVLAIMQIAGFFGTFYTFGMWMTYITKLAEGGT